MVEPVGGFPSPRSNESFPAGLRVLVVDDDLTWLKILEKMLKKCSYEVTTCCLARNALNLLRERKSKFDIVISDVNMPDMDGFKLLEDVGLEMDLPVIMMSVDGETSRVMKGVQHGACDYLLKPVRMKELRNIWQHVFRKKIHEVKDRENQDHGSSQSSQIKNGSDEFDDELILHGSDSNGSKKRKDMGTEEYTEQDFNNPGVVKKARVAWTVDLHQKFVEAVNQIGFDKVGPKKILDLMNVPWLTRENVASHLQKYRLYLSRIQKQNEPKNPICGVKQSEFSSKDTQGRFGIQSSTTQQNVSPSSFGYGSNKSIVEDAVQEISEDNLSMVSFAPSAEINRTLTCDDVLLAKKMNDGQQIGGVLSLAGMVTDFDYISSGQQYWNGEVSVMQLMQHPKQEKHYLNLEEGNPLLPLPTQQQCFLIDRIQSPLSTNSGNYITERDEAGPCEVKTLDRDYKMHHIRNVSPITGAVDSISALLGHEMVKHQGFEHLPAISSLSSTKFRDLDQNCHDTWNSDTNLTLNNSPIWASFPEDLQVCLFQGYGCFENVEVNNLAFFDCANSTMSIAELPSYTCDESGYDYQGESTEHPIIGEGLFE